MMSRLVSDGCEAKNNEGVRGQRPGGVVNWETTAATAPPGSCCTSQEDKLWSELSNPTSQTAPGASNPFIVSQDEAGSDSQATAGARQIPDNRVVCDMAPNDFVMVSYDCATSSHGAPKFADSKNSLSNLTTTKQDGSLSNRTSSQKLPDTTERNASVVVDNLNDHPNHLLEQMPNDGDPSSSTDCSQLSRPMGGSVTSLGDDAADFKIWFHDLKGRRAVADRVRIESLEALLRELGYLKRCAQTGQGQVESSVYQKLLSDMSQFENELLSIVRSNENLMNTHVPLKKSKCNQKGDNMGPGRSTLGAGVAFKSQQSASDNYDDSSTSRHSLERLNVATTTAHPTATTAHPTATTASPTTTNAMNAARAPNDLIEDVSSSRTSITNQPVRHNDHQETPPTLQAEPSLVLTEEATTETDENTVALLLVGSPGNGKSATGNSILGTPAFQKSAYGSVASESSTRIHLGCTQIGDRNVTVIDGPGISYSDTAQPDDVKKIVQDVEEALTKCRYRFSALLIVLKFGSRFTRQEVDTIRAIKSVLGDTVIEKYGVCVITCGDQFDFEVEEAESDGETLTLDSWSEKQTGFVTNLFKECNKRCVLFDNKTTDNTKRRMQVEKLMSVIPQGPKYTYHEYLGAKPGRLALEMAADLPLRLKDIKDKAIEVEKQINQAELDSGAGLGTYKSKMTDLQAALYGLTTQLQESGPPCPDVEGMSLYLRNLNQNITTKIRQRETSNEIKTENDRKRHMLTRSNTTAR